MSTQRSFLTLGLWRSDLNYDFMAFLVSFLVTFPANFDTVSRDNSQMTRHFRNKRDIDTLLTLFKYYSFPSIFCFM